MWIFEWVKQESNCKQLQVDFVQFNLIHFNSNECRMYYQINKEYFQKDMVKGDSVL